MAPPARHYFETLTALVKDFLAEINLTKFDQNSDRAIWEVHGFIGGYEIRLKEIFNQSGRIYSYYVIKAGQVVVGFDNYPDRRALREKYGLSFKEHLDELIAHKHGPRKEGIELTDEMTLKLFLSYLKDEKYLL